MHRKRASTVVADAKPVLPAVQKVVTTVELIDAIKRDKELFAALSGYGLEFRISKCSIRDRNFYTEPEVDDIEVEIRDINGPTVKARRCTEKSWGHHLSLNYTDVSPESIEVGLFWKGFLWALNDDKSQKIRAYASAHEASLKSPEEYVKSMKASRVQ